MPRPKRFTRRMEIYLPEAEYQLIKSTAELLGMVPADLIRAALVDNLEKARVNTNLWAMELMEAAK